jgi:hypothetical protein
VSTIEEHARKAKYMREWTRQNRERINAKRRQRRANNPELRRTQNEKSRAYRLEHLEQEREHHRQYREEHPEWKREASKRDYWKDVEKSRAKQRAKQKRLRIEKYIREHGYPPPPKTKKIPSPEEVAKRKARHLLISMESYRRHREELLERARIDRKNHPEKGRIHLQNRRARKRNIPGTHTKTEWEELCAKYDNRCVRCGEKVFLEADHVIPVTRQGSTNCISGLQPLCSTCNKIKMTKSTDYRPLWGNKIMWCNHAE